MQGIKEQINKQNKDLGQQKQMKSQKSEGKIGKKKAKGKGPKKPMLHTLIRLAGYARSHWLAILGAMIAVLISTGLGLIPPWLIRYAVDKLIIGKKIQFLWILAVSMVGAALLQGLIDFIKRYITEYVSQNIIHELRNELYEHLNKLSFSFYDFSRTGDIMSRVTADADALRGFLANASVYISGNILTIIGILVVMTVWNLRLALLYLLMLPLMVYGMFQYSNKVRPMFRQVRKKFAQLTEMVQEDVVGIEVIKLLMHFLTWCQLGLSIF